MRSRQNTISVESAGAFILAQQGDVLRLCGPPERRGIDHHRNMSQNYSIHTLLVRIASTQENNRIHTLLVRVASIQENYSKH